MLSLKIKKLLNLKVQGGALYIAILISIIIGILLTFFILISKFNQRTVTIFLQSSQLQQNLNSGFEIAKSNYFTDELNNKWLKNYTNDDSIRVKKNQWGAYLLITVDTKNRHQKISKCGLYGTFLPSDTALMISDNGRQVGVSGNVIFKANCYLPKAGIRPAYIEGQSYNGSGGNTQFIKTSPVIIPGTNENFRKSIENQRNISQTQQDSIAENITQATDQSFTKKTLVYTIGSTTLKNISFKNNIKLIGKNIIIEANCHLENILIVCDKINFKEGFKGSVHVIARDTIIMEKKCEFTFPSSFVLSDQNSNTPSLKLIQLNEDCQFYGGIIALGNLANPNAGKVFVKLHSKSEINGLIYSSDYAHIEGKINGTIICNNLLLKTPSAVYENHLLGCEIDPKKYSHLLSVPVIFNKTNQLLSCKTLK